MKSCCIFLLILIAIALYALSTMHREGAVAVQIAKVGDTFEVYYQGELHLELTPLTPSPVTPAQYAPILLDFDIHNKYKNKRRIFEGHNIKVSHSMYLDSAFMHFLSGFAIRYTDKYDSLYRLIISDKSFKQLKHSEKIEFIQKKYDINDIIREYSTEEPLPYWFLNSYVDVRRLAIMRKKMLKALHADYKFLEKPRQQELSDMMDFLNIIGASLKGKTNKQKKLEKYKHFLDNL